MTNNNSIVKLLIAQRDNIREWIEVEAAEALTEHRHLTEQSSERAYWHHGYQAALNDVIEQITAIRREQYSADKPN